VNRQIAVVLLLAFILVGIQPVRASNASGRLVSAHLLSSFSTPGVNSGEQSITALQTQANRIASVIASTNAQANLDGLHYLLAMQGLRIARERLKAIATELKSVTKKLSVTKGELYQVALSTYTDSGTTSSFMLLFASNLGEEGAGSVYLKVAADKLNGEEESFRGQEQQLAIIKTERTDNLKLAASNLIQATNDRQQVIARLDSEHTLLSQVNSRLSTLVAIQTAAREKAQAAALQLQERLLQQRLAARAAKRLATKHNSPTTTAPNNGAKTTTTVQTTTTLQTSGMNPTLAQDFAGIRNCESGGVYTLNTGNGYYGAYQFSASTWTGLGEGGLPNEAAPQVQDSAAYKLYQQSGWGSWPACAASLGLP